MRRGGSMRLENASAGRQGIRFREHHSVLEKPR
jgi:hypothetical protein